MTIDKTDDLLNTFRSLIDQYNIILDLDRDVNTLPAWEIVALDVEHDESGIMVGIGICHESSCIYFTKCTLELIDWLCKVNIIAHNGISDFECLRQWGINVKDIQLSWDTMLIGHILDSSLKSYGLKAMAKRELGLDYPSYDEIVGKKTLHSSHKRVTLDKQPIELVAMYNAMDTYSTYKLYEKQQKQNGQLYTAVQIGFPPQQTPLGRYFNDIEKPISQIFQKMMNRGVRIDLSYLRSLKDNLERQKSPIEVEIKNELGNINLNSPKQLLEALNAKEIYPELKGKPSTDKRAIAKYGDRKIIQNLLAFSELETLLSSFVSPYLERGQEVIHPYYNQCGTRTGRLSCSNPNLLQIPRRTENGKLVRHMFIPRKGMVMGDCDFGQIEPRILAHLSKDPVLCKLFNDNIDFHTFTAERLGISRDRAKILNLSVGYRATFKSVQAQLGGTDAEAQNEIEKWWALYPALRRWQDSLIYTSKGSGYCTTLLGRRIKVDNLNSTNKWQREAAERQLINNITQGSAAEIMKMAMIIIDRDLKDIGMLVQVYDELLFEEKDEYMEDTLLLVADRMKHCVKLDVPLTVECKTGANWADCR